MLPCIFISYDLLLQNKTKYNSLDAMSTPTRCNSYHLMTKLLYEHWCVMQMPSVWTHQQAVGQYPWQLASVGVQCSPASLAHGLTPVRYSSARHLWNHTQKRNDNSLYVLKTTVCCSRNSNDNNSNNISSYLSTICYVSEAWEVVNQVA